MFFSGYSRSAVKAAHRRAHYATPVMRQSCYRLFTLAIAAITAAVQGGQHVNADLDSSHSGSLLLRR